MREQQLIDLMFEIAMTAKEFKEKSNQEISEWVAQILNNNGFKTKPRGMSWGVLE